MQFSKVKGHAAMIMGKGSARDEHGNAGADRLAAEGVKSQASPPSGARSVAQKICH